MKRTIKGIFPPVYTSDCKGVLFTHELVSVLLPFSGKIAKGEMIAVEALMGSTIVAIKDGEGEAR